MILFDPGSSDLTPQLSQLPTKIVTRQWTYPLSLHCRNAISSMRLVTRPCLQISQMVGSSSAAISPSPSASPAAAPAARCRKFRRGSLILNLPLRSRHSAQTSRARLSCWVDDWSVSLRGSRRSADIASRLSEGLQKLVESEVARITPIIEAAGVTN